MTVMLIIILFLLGQYSRLTCLWFVSYFSVLHVAQKQAYIDVITIIKLL